MSSYKLDVRYNVINVSSVAQFAEITGSTVNNQKDVYFLREIGSNENLLPDIKNMDELLTHKTQKGMLYYTRIKAMPNLVNSIDVKYYVECCNNWNNQGRQNVLIKATANNTYLSVILSDALLNVIEKYRIIKNTVSPSMENNLIAKLMFWFDTLFNGNTANIDENYPVKIVSHNIEKPQEFLFFYMLTKIGFDVLLLQSKIDIPENLKSLNLSKELHIGVFSDINTPEYNPNDYSQENTHITQIPKSATTAMNNNSYITVTIPPRNRNKPSVTAVNSQLTENRCAQAVNNTPNTQRQEMDYEQLAMLAKSIVMISVHNEKGDTIAVGSGIMIGKNGYILTNQHVASGGSFYSVRIEDDNKIYPTTEIIKYNTTFDLAIIRIDRTLTPLPIYKADKKLVRGQKVVAIGSPLGLFNSVSDGIISGFRNIDNVEMIQFTAPISHGSSGGAVLNMYGEVIGISTSGIDSGQNINLAVGHGYINDFVRGFM